MISWVGLMIGSPFAGERILFVDIIRARASSWASIDNGTWTAIWSPSKSALKATQTNGWSWIALPSTSNGSNAWIPSLCKVGALFKRIGCSLMTSSNISHTSGVSLSTSFFAALMVVANSFCSSFPYTYGLNSSSAIFFGNPHWCNFRLGPATITDLPE